MRIEGIVAISQPLTAANRGNGGGVQGAFIGAGVAIQTIGSALSGSCADWYCGMG